MYAPGMTDIFEQIDHALDDWAVSGDAMRWAPDVEPTSPITHAQGGYIYTLPISVPEFEWTAIGWTEDGSAHRSQMTYSGSTWLDSTVLEAVLADAERRRDEWARAWTSVLRTGREFAVGFDGASDSSLIGCWRDGQTVTYAILDETHHLRDVADEIKAATTVSAETLAACRDALAEQQPGAGRGWRTGKLADPAAALDWKPA